MSEDQDLLAKIGQLAGQINQHRNQATTQNGSGRGGHFAPTYGNTHYTRVGWAPYRGGSNGRGRGRGRATASHRNRSLVINGSATAYEDSTDSPILNYSPTVDSGASTPTAIPGWVAKRDRHMQLINSSIYEQQAQARSKAIEETRKMKALQRDDKELAKLNQYLQQTHSQQITSSVTNAVPPRSQDYQITIQDIPFRVVKGGSKLVRISSEQIMKERLGARPGLYEADDPNLAKNTPKKAVVGRVTFLRSRNGNLYRLGSVKAKRRGAPVRKKNELCKRFTTTGTGFLPPYHSTCIRDDDSIIRDGFVLHQVGTCHKGPSCRFVHDPNKVAICKDFLQSKICPAGDSCDLSHEPSPERSPTCMHFVRGRCTNAICRYSHIRVNPGAPVCRAFATLGFCEKGANCDERHVHECPDYNSTGTCRNRKCRLPHIDRAGQIRKKNTNKAGNDSGDTGTEEDDDISSEEDDYDEIGSDEIDSDDMEEPEPMEIPDPGTGASLSHQQDFVPF